MKTRAEVEVTVLVSPVEPSSRRYRFVVRNLGRRTLTSLQVDCGGVLIADDFGVGSDYMAGELQGYRPPISIDVLAPGEEVATEQTCYGPLASYCGRRTRTVSIGYSLAGSASGFPLRGEAKLVITGGPSRMPVNLTHVAPGTLWLGLRPVIYLGLLGLLALMLIGS